MYQIVFRIREINVMNKVTELEYRINIYFSRNW